MIFRIKHFWPLAIVVTFVGVVASWSLEAWSNLPGNKFSIQMLIAIGVGGALAALMINGILHETFKRAIGKRYLASFQIYGQDVLDGMGWPAYIAAGLMAGMAEEPIFRGLLLPLIEDASGSAVVAGVSVQATSLTRASVFRELRHPTSVDDQRRDQLRSPRVVSPSGFRDSVTGDASGSAPGHRLAAREPGRHPRASLVSLCRTNVSRDTGNGDGGSSASLG